MPERFPPDDPREWINRAHSSMSIAKVKVDDAYLEDLCFLAQQAAEKSIKGVLMKYGVKFPYIHDIARLLILLEQAGLDIPQYVRMANRLTQFAVITRYPDISPPIKPEEYLESIKIAEKVVQWAEDIILSNPQNMKGVYNMPNIFYCLNTSTIRNCGLNIQEKIELAAKAGYHGIELWVSEIEEYVKGDGILAGVKKLKEIVDKNNIKVPNLIAFPQWANPDKEIRYKALLEAEQVFEIAQMLNCDFVAAPPFGITDMVDLPSKDIAGYYRNLMKAVESTGVKPLLEFWGHANRLGSLAEAMEILELVDSPDTLLLCDVFHMAKTEGSFELLKELKGSQIGLFHVNDYPQADDIRKLTDQQRVYPGDGVAPLDEIFGTLKDIGFNGMYSLELFNKEYEKAGAEYVVKTGLEKMKKAVEK